MDAFKDLLPLIGSLLGVLVTGAIGVATYSWQENTKRSTELIHRRQELYDNLNSAIFGLMLAKTQADRSRVLADVEKAWLFASDDVLAALFKYMNVFDRYWTQAGGDILPLLKQDAEIRQEIEQGMGEIFVAMRRDLRATKISNAVDAGYMQFYNCGMLDPFTDLPHLSSKASVALKDDGLVEA